MVQPFYDENNRKRIGMGKNTLDGAVKDVCVAYKSAKAKLEAGNIKKFRLRPKKKCSNKETIVIGHGAFSNKSTKKRRNSFAYRKLGEIKSSVPFIDNTREARLTFDKRRNKFYLFIVKETRVFKVDDRQKECSLDPGLRMFQTCYDKKKCFSFGENIKGFVEPILKKIDRIANFQNKFWYKKYTQRLRDKIRNKIDNIHWNICKILVTRYNEITIGKLSTKIVSKKGFMTKMNKRLYYALSHYTFRQRLKFKCQEYGVKFNEQNESYTTKKCGGCGKLNEVGTAKVFNCVFCDFTWGRDQNGARNIMIRKDLGL
jgi:putative transposase